MSFRVVFYRKKKSHILYWPALRMSFGVVCSICWEKKSRSDTIRRPLGRQFPKQMQNCTRTQTKERKIIKDQIQTERDIEKRITG